MCNRTRIGERSPGIGRLSLILPSRGTYLLARHLRHQRRWLEPERKGEPKDRFQPYGALARFDQADMRRMEPGGTR